MARFTSKNVKETDKSFISFIYFLYALFALKIFLSRRVANILRCSLPDTGHGMVVDNFNGFSLAVYCIFVICHKNSVRYVDLCFQPGMSDFARATLLIRIEGA